MSKIIHLSILYLLLFYSCSTGDQEIETVDATFETEFVNVNYDSLTMDELLNELSEAAITFDEFKFKTFRENWIGYPPANDSLIAATELKLNVQFPEDYKAFIKITNGFPAVNGTEPSFLPIQKVDYTLQLEPSVVESFGNDPNLDKAESTQYKKSIIIGGVGEEQHFLLIPPSNENEKWEYWFFAYWAAGEIKYESLKDYFISSLHLMREDGESGF